ncbi:hypothetical protein MNVI_45390 [Mycobacterium noviomagense]|uniref:Catalase n=1 Tax=Mycobacterium noviomagense TaxID=459858 RepID=A0A7I7PKW2_9MYCO|nr:hypothetical protein MNVI_45390 [Mycobacterium noviomagense]
MGVKRRDARKAHRSEHDDRAAAGRQHGPPDERLDRQQRVQRDVGHDDKPAFQRPHGARQGRGPISQPVANADQGPARLTPQVLIDGFAKVFGRQSGFRKNHAKGLAVAGYFDGNGDGAELSKAAVFRSARTPVIGRFSLAQYRLRPLGGVGSTAGHCGGDVHR